MRAKETRKQKASDVGYNERGTERKRRMSVRDRDT